MKLNQLIKQARESALLWDDCDKALNEVNDAFGASYEAARDKLNSSLTVADQNGFEMSQLQGDDSAFRFPDLGTLVVVRVSKLPTPHKSLETIEMKIERLERELKLAKTERKHLIERLKINAHEFVTEKVTTAFKRITK